jgi:tetratricopeptide (TPR) repeat protein
VARDPLKPGRRQTAPVTAKVQPRRVERFIIPALLAAIVVAVVAAVLQRSSGPEAYVAAPVTIAVVPKGVSVPAATTTPSPDQPEPVRRPFMDAGAEGATAYTAGDYPAALAQFTAAVERNPLDAEAHSNLGQVLVRLNRPADALPHFDQALSLIPNRWAYHFNRARALSLLDRWDDAIASYRQAQSLFPGDYATAFNLARAFDHQGRGREAAESYRDYLRLAPDAPDADKVRTRLAQLGG